MKQVLEERKMQMEDKLKMINVQKLESLERREELIRDMEKTQHLAMLEKEKAEKQKHERKADIEAQMSAHKEISFANNILKNVDEYEKEQIKNDQMQHFVNREKEKQIQTSFEPKVIIKAIIVYLSWKFSILFSIL